MTRMTREERVDDMIRRGWGAGFNNIKALVLEFIDKECADADALRTRYLTKVCSAHPTGNVYCETCYPLVDTVVAEHLKVFKAQLAEAHEVLRDLVTWLTSAEVRGINAWVVDHIAARARTILGLP
jgi:hypothetical protein